MSHTDVIIDVDPRNGGRGSYEQLCKDLNLQFEPTVHTPSGGFHIYLTLPEPTRIRKSLKAYPGIDFLSKGQFVVIPPSTINRKTYHFDCEFMEEYDSEPIPPTLLAQISKGTIEESVQPNRQPALPTPAQPKVESEHQDITCELLRQATMREKYSAAEVEDLLNKVSYSEVDTYEGWTAIGMAIKSWDPTDTGFNIWYRWSSKSPKFDETSEEKMQSKWQGFNTTPGDRTYTMSHIANLAWQGDLEEEMGRMNVLNTYIEHCEDQSALISHVKKELTFNNFGSLSHGIIIDNVRQKIKKLTGSLPTKTAISSMFPASNSLTNLRNAELEDRPEWTKEFVYVEDQDRYMLLKNRQLIKQAAFQMRYGRMVPSLDGNSSSKMMPDTFLKTTGFAEIVDSTIFYPLSKEPIISLKDGNRYANIFKPHLMPKPAEEYTDRGRERIAIFEEHMSMICNYEEEYTDIMLDWFAHQVQKPGEKILWCPLIKSKQGLGKSLTLTLMKNIIAEQYVQMIKCEDLFEHKNGWATGSCVTVLEELYVPGKNRHEVENKLKPLISDPVISVRELYQDTKNMYNVTNYIAFTNKVDALPLDKGDRRYFVIFNEIDCIETHIMDKYGLTVHEYFVERLKKCFDDEAQDSQILKYLMERDLTTFETYIRAPDTVYKTAMIEAAEDDKVGHSNAKHLIELGGEMFGEEVISSTHFWDAYRDMFQATDDCSFLTNPRMKNRILKDLGYMQRTLKMDGKSLRVWIKRNVDNKFIREYLAGKYLRIDDF